MAKTQGGAACERSDMPQVQDAERRWCAAELERRETSK